MLFILIVAVITTNGLIVPWDKGHFICEKSDSWGDSRSVIMSDRTNETECLNMCDRDDECVAVSYVDDNGDGGRCITMSQCLLSIKKEGYKYYYKKGFNNGENYTISYGATCESPHIPITTNIGSSTVPQCWKECMNLDGCNYAQINKTLGCNLYSECKIVLDDNWYLRMGMVINASSITDNDSTTPTPTSAPTITNEKQHTSVSTDAPTVSTTTLRDGQILGIAIGVLILILLIILLIVCYL